ncbi:hypothetical protein AX16_001354 [Volvariella volvacea WC 439]|nr:hypothetical protein AX16_001354 [Volvariella volvacea WC 439]
MDLTESPKAQEKKKASELLEVEDEEARRRRIQFALERLNSSTSTSHDAPRTDLKFDFGDRTTFPVSPPTSLLSRVQAFLPQLAASNEELERLAAEDPLSVDIEHIDKGVQQYIEMVSVFQHHSLGVDRYGLLSMKNLGLGIFEDRSKRSEEDDENDDETSDSSSLQSSDDESTSSEENSSGDEESAEESEVDMVAMPPRPIKPLPKRKVKSSRPSIVTLDEQAK